MNLQAEEAKQYGEKLTRELKARGRNLLRDGSFSKVLNSNWQVMRDNIIFENITSKTALHILINDYKVLVVNFYRQLKQL